MSQAEFCRSIGVSSAYVSSIQSGLSDGKKFIIKEKYPELSIEWLLFGKGNMLTTDVVVDHRMVKDRLREFIATENMTVTLFCQKIGVTTGYVNAIRKSIGEDTLIKIKEVFPKLNTDWLITGCGEMYNETKEVEALRERIKELEAQVKVLKELIADINGARSKTIQV